MGIPYSKQINAAFDQVTPLVASAYEVLQTTKDIAILLTVIQCLMIFLLTLILLALVGLLYTLNPDLEKERKALVTPAMKWIASWHLSGDGHRRSIIGSFLLLLVLCGFGFLFYVYYSRQAVEDLIERDEQAHKDEGTEKEGKGNGNGNSSGEEEKAAKEADAAAKS